DVVDSTGSWSRERMDWKNGAYDGLNSVVGTNFIVTNGQTGDHHVDRFFDAGITIQEGTYTITFSMGKLDSLAFMSNKFAGLISDSWSWNNRITSGMTIESGPTPNTENKWVTWKITYTVDAETKSAAGTSVVGTRLGFAILASGDGSSSSYAFDNLTIAYTPNSVVPEPATTAALAGMIVLLAVLGFRARRHR
ncbi:MAG: hypothetical protein LBK99_12890, partial [Opitutaceae bacterium]|nr:hypothetical protein [Opitutaceae bacterium]